MKKHWIVTAVMFMAMTSLASAEFTAYNDFVTSYTNNSNVTHWGQPNAGTGALTLIDEATGYPVTPTMTITRLNTTDNGGGPGSEIAGGTDAAAIFGGKVACQGNVTYYGTQNNWWYNVAFNGLDNSLTYNVAAVIDRGDINYENVRWSMISLVDAESSTYASSAGAYKVSETSTTMTVYNTVNGYVAKWTDIKPGSDGTFSLYFSSPTDLQIPEAYRPQASDQIGKGYAPAGIMIQEIGGSVPQPPPPPIPLIATCYFDEPPAGTQNWTPGAGNEDLGFTTTLISGTYNTLGTYDSGSSPWRYRMRTCQAKVTMDTVDLSQMDDVTAAIDVLLTDNFEIATPPAVTDYFRVTVTNGTDTITLADYAGAAMQALAKNSWLHYEVDIPDAWDAATMVFSSSTNSSGNSEIVNFDNIEFRGNLIPEPATMALLALGGLAMLKRRKK